MPGLMSRTELEVRKRDEREEAQEMACPYQML
jgi:hypothetical protein